MTLDEAVEQITSGGSVSGISYEDVAIKMLSSEDWSLELFKSVHKGDDMQEQLDMLFDATCRAMLIGISNNAQI